MIHFTADTHSGHERTRTLHKRPFAGVDEMNAALIANWSSSVSPEDIVYHLGDFGTPDPQILQRLNGSIFFLPSQDHDEDEVFEALSQRATIIQPNTVLTFEGGESFQLLHEPSSAIESGNFLLCGRTHRLQMVKRNGICVSADAPSSPRSRWRQRYFSKMRSKNIMMRTCSRSG